MHLDVNSNLDKLNKEVKKYQRGNPNSTSKDIIQTRETYKQQKEHTNASDTNSRSNESEHRCSGRV